tara:strand:+ start:304 stop:2430 length:2127 start_codon:yes stop_codon:yes gene_type:complete
MPQQVRDNEVMAPNEQMVDLGEIFRIIWRGKWFIGALASLFLVVAFYYAYVIVVPQYRATAVVILETQQENVVDLQSVVGGLDGDTSTVNSEVEVLKARGLMGKVVDRLDLVNDPEFNRSLQEPDFKTRAKAVIKTLIGWPEAPRPDLSEDAIAKRAYDKTVSALLDSVTIKNITKSLVFQVTVESQDRAKSALIADTIVEVYILNQLEVKFDATEQATTWLSERVAALQIELQEAEAKVADFSGATDLISVDSLKALERQAKELRDRIASATAATAAARAKSTAFENLQTREERVAAAGDPQLERLLPRVATDAAIGTAFDMRFEQLKVRAELETDRAVQQLTALQDSAVTIETQINEQSQDLIALQQLQREAEATRLLYEYFLGRLKETSAQEGIQRADSRILSKAVVPETAATPRKLLILVVSMLLGAGLGSLFVLLREARSNTFRTARDLEIFTGETVLGQIPLIPASVRKKVVEYLADKPTSAAAEAIRNLRTSILLSDVDNPPKVIVSTSSLPGEGKTTNSLALAQNLIGMGNKVLLIEGDIRRRTFNEYFKNIPSKGMVSVLSGDTELDAAIFREPGFDCDLLVGEKTATNAADLFSSEKFRLMLQELRTRYDIIVIDTPPVLIVPDARIIAKQADAVLFTVKWDATTAPQVEEALRLFRDANQKVTGLVLSQISPKGMKRYGYGGEYGAYARYGAKYYDN